MYVNVSLVNWTFCNASYAALRHVLEEQGSINEQQPASPNQTKLRMRRSSVSKHGRRKKRYATYIPPAVQASVQCLQGPMHCLKSLCLSRLLCPPLMFGPLSSQCKPTMSAAPSILLHPLSSEVTLALHYACRLHAHGHHAHGHHACPVRICVVVACDQPNEELVQAFGSWMSAYTQMGVKAYQSEHGAKQRRFHSRHPAFDHVHKPKHPSNVLFSWLFKACVTFQLYKWLQVNTFAHAMKMWWA